MGKINALDTDTSIMNNLPLGYYYYYIPYDKLEYGKFLGVCSAIESLTYNPFLNENNVTYLETAFDNEKYGAINGGTCTIKRIMSCSEIKEELSNNIKLFEWKSPFDMKLQCYPYSYFIITDYMNEPLLIKPQLVYNTDNKLIVKIETTAISGRYRLYVENNKNDRNGKLEGITNNMTYQLPVTSTAYSQFYASSMSSFNNNITNSLLENDMTLRQNVNTATLNTKQSEFNAGLSAIASLLTGNLTGAVSNGVSLIQQQEKLDNLINNLNEQNKFKENEIISSKNAKINDLLNTPNSIKTSGNDSVFNLSVNNRKIDVIKYTITPQYKKRINNYFKRYGYAFNDYAVPDIYSRQHYNFLKCNVCHLISETIPREHQEEIKQIFESGITMWHLENGVKPLDYSVPNHSK